MHIHTFIKLLFLAVLAVMLFTCPESGCNLSFTSARGLNQHRQQCIYAQDESLTLGGASALARLNEKRAKKRQRLNPPDPQGEPEMAGPSNLSHEVSFIFYNSIPQTLTYFGI